MTTAVCSDPRWTNLRNYRRISDRHRPRKRKYPSGAQKARLAEEKRESMLPIVSKASGSSSYDENSQMPSQNSIGSQGSQESSLSMTGISETEPDPTQAKEPSQLTQKLSPQKNFKWGGWAPPKSGQALLKLLQIVFSRL